MVKRNEKKVVVALSIALLLAFSLVASLIPGINSKAAATAYKGTISVTIPPVGSPLNQSSLDKYIASSSTPDDADAFIVAASRPPSLDEVNEWLLEAINAGGYVTPSWGYNSDYSTTVEAGKEYYFVYVFYSSSLLNMDSKVTVNGATEEEFLGVKINSTPTGQLGMMAGWVKVSIPEVPSSDTTVNPGSSSTSASTDTNTVPATNSVTPSADTTPTSTTKATAPKTEDALPIVLVLSIIGAGALTSVITIVSRKRQ